jgi:integrating conjugative element protein (TIGR03759 family)
MSRAVRALLAMLIFGTFAGADAQLSETQVENTEAVFTEEALAKTWQLSMEEWTRYRTLMEGPRGIWSPNLDPITVLGIHAETDAERDRYAELLVLVEFERVERELKFQRAYDEAARRLFSDLPRVASLETRAGASLLPGVERLAFIGSIDPERCPACQRELARLLRDRSGSNVPALDVFVADAADDEALRRWARNQGVSPDEMRAGRITLNHARGPLAIAPHAGPVSPRLMQRLAGRWLPLASMQ